MLNLVHNVDFVIAAVAILLVIYCSVGKRYAKISRSNRMFYRMVNTAMVQCIVDILMNAAQTYTDVVPAFWAAIGRTAFNTCTVVLVYFGYEYVKAYSTAEWDGSKLQRLMDIVVYACFIIYVAVGIINFFTGCVSYVDEYGNYQTGSLYSLNYYIPALLTIILLLTAILHRQDYMRHQFWAIVAFVSLSFAGVMVESFTQQDTLFIMFSVSLALLVVQLSLETPDYHSLAETMEELKESNREAMDARAEADKANKSKSDFLARMSHEIRTPMNAIIGMNEMIVRETFDPVAKEHAVDAMEAANNLLSIINEILDFSKIESGKLEIVEGEYSLSELLRSEYSLFSMKTEEKGLALKFNVDSAIPDRLIGDEMRIRQIISNLLSNAIKYSDSGTITLDVVRESITPEKTILKFSVKDNGQGIREEDMDRLFGVFERVNLRKNHNIEGTGLGLSIVAALLNMMDSKIEVSSEYGKGSVFYFSLPQVYVNLTPIGEFKVVSDGVITSGKGGKREQILIDNFKSPDSKILVVDDNEINLKVFEVLLKSTGVQITKARSGAEALELTKKFKYDLIFMDHMMPEMDGVETREQIIADEEGLNRDTPEVVLTANAIKGAQDEYREIGFDAVVFKPASQSDLVETLMKFL